METFKLNLTGELDKACLDLQKAMANKEGCARYLLMKDLERLSRKIKNSKEARA